MGEWTGGVGARAYRGRVRPDDEPASAEPRRGETGVGATRARPGAINGAEAALPADGDAVTGAVVRWVPESASLGISALVAATYLRRIRRRRAQARAARGDDEAVADPDPAAVVLEARLGPFADAPVLEWLELANRHLTAALRSEEGRSAADQGRPGSGRTGSRSSSTRPSTGLRDPLRWPRTEVAGGCPPRSTERCSGLTRAGNWRAAPAVARRRRRQRDLSSAPRTRRIGVIGRPRCPADVGVVGRDRQVLALGRASGRGPRHRDGRSTGAAVRWSEHPRGAGHSALYGRSRRAVGGGARDRRLGDLEPEALAPRSVMVTAEEAIIEPSGSRCSRVASTLPPRAYWRPSTARPSHVWPRKIKSPGIDEEMGGGQTTLRSSAELLGAGPIEVRLLTFTPQIVGLAKPLPTNKAVRITELVAWLALQGNKRHHLGGDVGPRHRRRHVTKTLYNMVSDARAAFGTDASGASRLIFDRSTGVYRLADDVTVDVLRFVQMAERGIDSEEPHASAELCRAALNLIEDTRSATGAAVTAGGRACGRPASDVSPRRRLVAWPSSLGSN